MTLSKWTKAEKEISAINHKNFKNSKTYSNCFLRIISTAGYNNTVKLSKLILEEKKKVKIITRIENIYIILSRRKIARKIRYDAPTF